MLANLPSSVNNWLSAIMGHLKSPLLSYVLFDIGNSKIVGDVGLCRCLLSSPVLRRVRWDPSPSISSAGQPNRDFAIYQPTITTLCSHTTVDTMSAKIEKIIVRLQAR